MKREGLLSQSVAKFLSCINTTQIVINEATVAFIRYVNGQQ